MVWRRVHCPRHTHRHTRRAHTHTHAHTHNPNHVNGFIANTHKFDLTTTECVQIRTSESKYFQTLTKFEEELRLAGRARRA